MKNFRSEMKERERERARDCPARPRDVEMKDVQE
jgi:hypothetical protein